MTSDEFVIEARDENAFDALLKRYSGTVLKDGTIPAPPTGILKSATKSNWKLVRLKSPTTTVEALAVSLDKAGAKGKVRVSDQQAVNQMNFLLQNASSEGLTVEANYVLKPQSYASPFSSEQFLGANGYFKPLDSWWLSNRYGGSGDATGAWGEGMDGTGVTIAIIDVGFKKENPDLLGINPTNNQRVNTRSVSGYNFTAGAYDPYNSWGADSTGDVIGNVSWHGQGVADVALGANNNQYGTSGVAPNANAYLFRLGRGSTGYSYYDAGVAVDTARAWGANIINMSFSGLSPGAVGAPNTYLGAAIDRADAAGVIVVAALGNNSRYVGGRGAAYPWFLYPIPAFWSPVIAVGAVNIDGNISSYSNYGDRVDIYAPAGEGSDFITTSLPGGDSCWSSGALACQQTPNGVTLFNGTSASSPYVAGVIALMKQAKPSLSKTQILQILRNTAFKPNGGVRSTNGVVQVAGVVQAGNAVRAAKQ